MYFKRKYPEIEGKKVNLLYSLCVFGGETGEKDVTGRIMIYELHLIGNGVIHDNFERFDFNGIFDGILCNQNNIPNIGLKFLSNKGGIF